MDFETFLSAVEPQYKDFVNQINTYLLANKFKIKLESKASGYFALYSHSKTNRSFFNFFFRKKGIHARIYADNYAAYADYLNTIPENMEKEIEKASECKRLINPANCNPKCVMGLDFYINENHYQKCRHSCFQFQITDESIPFIENLVRLECEQRSRK